MKLRLSSNLLVLFIMGIVIFGCRGTENFAIKETVNDKTVGFVNEDILQVIGSGYAGLQTVDSKKRMVQAKAAAVIKARMNAVEYLLSELKESKEYYFSLINKTGEFISSRYDPIYGKTLLDGDAKVNGIFNMLNLKGYVYKISYDSDKGFCKVTYRLVQASLRSKAKRGFSN